MCFTHPERASRPPDIKIIATTHKGQAASHKQEVRLHRHTHMIHTWRQRHPRTVVNGKQHMCIPDWKVRTVWNEGKSSECGGFSSNSAWKKYRTATTEMLHTLKKQTKEWFTVRVLYRPSVALPHEHTSVRNYIIIKCHTAFISAALEKLPLSVCLHWPDYVVVGLETVVKKSVLSRTRICDNLINLWPEGVAHEKSKFTDRIWNEH